MARELRKHDVEAMAIRADVSGKDDVRTMLRTMLDAWDTIDLLVANAGLQQDAAVTAMTLAPWNTVIGVNFTGAFLCAREAAREMIRRGRRSHGLPASSLFTVHERIPWADHVTDTTSKGGRRQLRQSRAHELAPPRMRVNSIGPGAIPTPIDRSAWDTPEALQRLLALIPDGRLGQPEDIGTSAVWLCSDDLDYVHGPTLFVAGGMTLYPDFARGG